MTRKVVIASLALAAVGLSAAGVCGQDSLLAEIYGQGVHAYFARDYQRAHRMLTTVIDQATQDPRAYYFRGLTYLQAGRPDQAEQDFQKGAELEAAGGPRVYPVGRSLQRIQGPSRLTLERHRQTARLAARIQGMNAQQARYEELQRAEGEVLRNPDREPAAEVEDLLAAPAAQDATDPFTGEEETPEAAPPRPEPAEVAGPSPPAAAAEPSAAPAPAAAAPATPADPFGDAAVDPFADDMPAEPAPAPADDPFSDPFN